MRTTIDIPGPLLKKAKLKATMEGISLKELFTRSLENELSGSPPPAGAAPWKQLLGKGSAEDLEAEDSGFDDYTGPDWKSGSQVNEPD